MLKLLHNKDLPEAFNISLTELNMLEELIAQVADTKGDVQKVTWVVERLWIDERFSDNLRAYAIFKLGYHIGFKYALQNGKEE